MTMNNVAYLEESDFDTKGNLINPDIPHNKPVVVMMQASWCPHCKHATPDFDKFAELTKGKVFCATIQSDGDRESEKTLGKRIKETIKSNFRGFPDYALYKNGKRVDVEISGRSVEDLKKFAGV